MKNDIDKILPKDFNIEYYKKLNNDLQNLSNIEAIEHYINYGKKELRKYKFEYDLPKDFNPIEYKILNDDLKFLNDIEASHHYLIYGIEEKRKYKKKLKQN